METKLARISQLSKENPDMVFTSLGHLLNKESHNEMLELLDEFYGYMSWNCSKKYAKYSQKYKS